MTAAGVKQRALIASRASSVLHDVAYLAGRDRAFPFHSFLYTYSVPPGTSYLLAATYTGLPPAVCDSRQVSSVQKLYFASLSLILPNVRPAILVKTYGYGAKRRYPPPRSSLQLDSLQCFKVV